MPKFDGEKAFAAIERFRVNEFYMPPILLKRLLLSARGDDVKV